MLSGQTHWIIPAVLIAGYLYLITLIRSLNRSMTRTDSEMDVRITSLETQIRDLQHSVARIEAKLDVLDGQDPTA